MEKFLGKFMEIWIMGGNLTIFPCMNQARFFIQDCFPTFESKTVSPLASHFGGSSTVTGRTYKVSICGSIPIITG